MKAGKGGWSLAPVSEFNAVATAWDELNRGRGGLPILESRFVACLLRHFADDSQRVAFLEDAAGPLAVAVLEPARRLGWSTFQPSQAPVGLWLQRPESSFDQALKGLFETLPGMPALLSVLQQDPRLAPTVDENGAVALSTMDYIRTARVPIDRDFEQYWAERGKNLRHNMKRQRNRLEREDMPLRVERIASPGAMAAAVNDYGLLESAGWKGADGTAVHPDNAQGRFYAELMETFAATGDGEVHCLYYGDKLVAVDLWLFGGGTAVIIKTTYDESQSSTSPALLLHQEEFRDLFARPGLHAIEFYGKVMEWHTKWSEDARTLYHVTAYRNRVVAALDRARRQAAKPEA